MEDGTKSILDTFNDLTLQQKQKVIAIALALAIAPSLATNTQNYINGYNVGFNQGSKEALAQANRSGLNDNNYDIIQQELDQLNTMFYNGTLGTVEVRKEISSTLENNIISVINEKLHEIPGLPTMESKGLLIEESQISYVDPATGEQNIIWVKDNKSDSGFNSLVDNYCNLKSSLDRLVRDDSIDECTTAMKESIKSTNDIIDFCQQYLIIYNSPDSIAVVSYDELHTLVNNDKQETSGLSADKNLAAARKRYKTAEVAKKQIGLLAAKYEEQTLVE